MYMGMVRANMQCCQKEYTRIEYDRGNETTMIPCLI